MVEIKIEKNGKEYFGKYKIEKGLITVFGPDGQRTTTQLGNSASNPESLARIILSKFINN